METLFYNLWQKIIGPQPIVGITDLNRSSPPPHPIIGPSLTSSQENLSAFHVPFPFSFCLPSAWPFTMAKTEII